ncbi:MAG: bifunctional phosphoribosylaminoimidazolecarboxamide formyltransferase/IMP cyclohydrolase [Phycisphaerales bacterium JB039]
MADLVRVRRAIISVSDKTDLVPLARALVARGVEIISTGGTARALTDAGLDVTPIDSVTGFPEIMDGRVKTLHPAVHGGLLAVLDKPEHIEAMGAHGIEPIDMVCINLYPFERTIGRGDIEQAEAIEQIDIGGPSMIRSAAKNFARVTVVTDPRQYDRVVSELDEHDGATSLALRADLAGAAFSRTSEYDAAIASYLTRRAPRAFPPVLQIRYTKVDDLRYGENPHQEAALYRDPASTGPSVVGARQLHGRQLSYNNIADAAAALELVKALKRLAPERCGCAIVKHTNPCGGALADDAAGAVDLAFAGDPVAAFGGILACHAEIDLRAARRIAHDDAFLEVVIAPRFAEDALELLQDRWKNVRLLATGDARPSTARKLEYRSIAGGMLVQDRDIRTPESRAWTLAAGPAPDEATLQAAAALMILCRGLTRNAVIVGGREGAGVRLFGAGAGQMDRVTACRLAVDKAGPLAAGAIACSDGFFPFPDGPQILLEAGVRVIVQPGGSKRDGETVELCNARGATLLMTGVRHFRH